MSWCIGYRRNPHVTDTVRPRKPDAIPLCDACELARLREAGR